MIIGINATAAFTQPRTGVEECAYRIIKSLTESERAKKHSFVLYVPSFLAKEGKIDFLLPANFEIRPLRWPFRIMWTQLRLASQMAFSDIDALLIPAHVLPMIHPKNSVVMIYGLEYEYYPKHYPRVHARYLKAITKYALRNANKVIVSSQSTKNDLRKIYNSIDNDISVVHLGFANHDKIKREKPVFEKPYILYLGRVETKKNICNLITAFELLKKKWAVPHRLVLAGANGFGYGRIKLAIEKSKFRDEIIQLGYVSEDEKWSLLEEADIFAFVSFCEGFGIPVLEAQSVGCPVLSSNISSLPEVLNESGLMTDPWDVEEMSSKMYKMIEDRELKKRLIRLGYENIKRFSWDKTAEKILSVLEK